VINLATGEGTRVINLATGEGIRVLNLYSRRGDFGANPLPPDAGTIYSLFPREDGYFPILNLKL
jgi:hypothetical protein